MWTSDCGIKIYDNVSFKPKETIFALISLVVLSYVPDFIFTTGKIPSILSTPYIRLTSSIKSSLIEISNLLDGTVTVTDSSFWIYLKSNFLNTSTISSFEISVPNKSQTSLYFKSITFSSFSVLSYLHIPDSIVASAYCSNNLQALSIAMYVLFGSIPFSNLLLASLLNIFLDVFLTLTESNIADSITTFFVVFSTSVESPPITPARPIAFSPFEITISFSSKVLSVSSNVVSFSPFSAILTCRQFPNLSAS